MFSQLQIVVMGGVEAALENLETAPRHAWQELLLDEEITEGRFPGVPAEQLTILAQKSSAAQEQIPHVYQVTEGHTVAEPEAAAGHCLVDVERHRLVLDLLGEMPFVERPHMRLHP